MGCLRCLYVASALKQAAWPLVYMQAEVGHRVPGYNAKSFITLALRSEHETEEPPRRTLITIRVSMVASAMYSQAKNPSFRRLVFGSVMKP